MYVYAQCHVYAYMYQGPFEQGSEFGVGVFGASTDGRELGGMLNVSVTVLTGEHVCAYVCVSDTYAYVCVCMHGGLSVSLD